MWTAGMHDHANLRTYWWLFYTRSPHYKYIVGREKKFQTQIQINAFSQVPPLHVFLIEIIRKRFSVARWHHKVSSPVLPVGN